MNSLPDSGHIPIQRAFFIKLGAGSQWADDSIRNGLLRFGWSDIPLIEILDGDWESVSKRVRGGMSDKGAATRDINGLRDLVYSNHNDVWITFHRSKLWWGHLTDAPIEEDAISKFRRLAGSWKDSALDGRLLIATQIPGVLSAVQGYRGTVCSVRAPAVLQRLLNSEPSPAYMSVEKAKHALSHAVENAVRELHWKDFETLVDLVFRHAGWRRVSLLGETMKFADLELEDPITRDRYQVQIKARADLADFERYAREFSRDAFRRLYFVVHSPTEKLQNYTSPDESILLVRPSDLAGMIVDAGLTSWLLDRVR
jgi:hypothetical protein